MPWVVVERDRERLSAEDGGGHGELVEGEPLHDPFPTKHDAEAWARRVSARGLRVVVRKA